MPCAASPPSAFCQEKVTTSSLSKARSWAKAAEVASQMVRPSRSAGIQSPFGHAHAGGRAVPGEDHVVGEVDLAEVGQLAVVGLDGAGVLELQLLDDVGHPAERRSFPRRARRPAAAPSSDHSAISTRAGVGGGHDADQIVGGNLQHLAGEVDGLLELGLADLGAVRAAERGIASALPATSRGAWRRDRKKNRDWPAGAGRVRRDWSSSLPSQIGAPRWGGVSRRRHYACTDGSQCGLS